MSAKKAGCIKSTSQKNVGRLYRPHSSMERSPRLNIHKPHPLDTITNAQKSSTKKRTNSVGKIYTTQFLDRP